MMLLFWMAILVCMIWFYSRLWERNIQKNAEIIYELPHKPVQEDDQIEFWIRIENKSYFPIPLIHINQLLPEGLRWIYDQQAKQKLSIRTYLLPKQRVRKRYRIRCLKRGYYFFEPVRCVLYDGIGLNEVHIDLPTDTRLLVRPQPMEEEFASFSLTELSGEYILYRWYHGDETRISGVREYTANDPYKQIDWKATAKTGKLMVKEYDTTSQTSIHVMLNLQSHDYFRLGIKKEIVDQQCRVAAAIFLKAQESGFPYGLFSNAAWSGPGVLKIEPNCSYDHLDFLLSLLGKIKSFPSCPFSSVLKKYNDDNISKTNHLIILTSFWNKEITERIGSIIKRGSHVSVIAFPPLSRKDIQMEKEIPIYMFEELTNHGGE
ncbi:DUF58 domain-containing protein [Thermoactinomyces sp. CICC 10522]|uniref:DUF58 domain-containing protein n=1 Tax=Thermoactinomyces sp. CICC 10522 TaxID=2767427 RepID=UPI0018DEC059|nr:DUF58 domain-containing protein [Thermoactinomyces sp. CICC 10522]MBH8605542.1 DUF58 domain-containing protein [Thermoactinomyces sp. CICC 10522]